MDVFVGVLIGPNLTHYVNEIHYSQLSLSRAVKK